MQFNPQILVLVQLLVLIWVLELEYRKSIVGKFLHNPNKMHIRPFRCASNAAHEYFGVLDKLSMSRSTQVQECAPKHTNDFRASPSKSASKKKRDET